MIDFSHNHYVPALRAMQGEFAAISDVPDDVRRVITPLWDVVPDLNDEGDQDPTADLGASFDRLPQRIHNACRGLSSFIDPFMILPDRRRPDGEHILRYLCVRTRDLGTPLIPVVGVNSDAAYVDAANTVHRDFESGIAVRVTFDELPNVGTLQVLLASLEGGFADWHLIIDCEYVDDRLAAILPVVIPTLVNAILALGPWRTFTLLSGSFPEHLGGTGMGIIPLTRHDWNLWQTMVPPGVLNRRPAYGDYGIQHPIFAHAPYTGNAAIRYTDRIEFVIFRANRLIARYGAFQQFFALAQTCISHPAYRGSTFSPGDAYIDSVANHAAGPGNLVNWRDAGMSQHITYVGRVVPTIP